MNGHVQWCLTIAVTSVEIKLQILDVGVDVPGGEKEYRPGSDGNIVEKYRYISIFLDIKSIDTNTKISWKEMSWKSDNVAVCNFKVLIIFLHTETVNP